MDKKEKFARMDIMHLSVAEIREYLQKLSANCPLSLLCVDENGRVFVRSELLRGFTVCGIIYAGKVWDLEICRERQNWLEAKEWAAYHTLGKFPAALPKVKSFSETNLEIFNEAVDWLKYNGVDADRFTPGSYMTSESKNDDEYLQCNIAQNGNVEILAKKHEEPSLVRLYAEMPVSLR